MQIYELLKKDHREVKKMFEQAQGALDDGNLFEAEKVFYKMRTELTAHSKSEEEVFYQPLKALARDEKSEELSWEGQEEHHVIALLLNELSRISVNEDAWKAKLTVLSELVDHHVEEEEGEIFKVAKKHFSDAEAEEIAEQMTALKERYKTMIDDALEEDVEIFTHPMRKIPSEGLRPSA
ncbi:hemerythrin domain-containing protein [Bdellovibrio bacteriovorus]|uniref:hemerythrin domain-containing protein n=1 Tax=Bdellovibrio bacteriovorus TaxID=959 RepID=UPI003A80ED29